MEKEGCGQELKHIDLTGCLYITDLTLQRVGQATNRQSSHNSEEAIHQTEISLIKKTQAENLEKPYNEADLKLFYEDTEEKDKTCKKCASSGSGQEQVSLVSDSEWQPESHCKDSVQKVCIGCRNKEESMDCCVRRKRDKCNTDICDDCDKAEKREGKEMVYCCIGRRFVDGAVDRCRDCWSQQESCSRSTVSGCRRDHTEDNALMDVDQPAFQGCGCESLTQSDKISIPDIHSEVPGTTLQVNYTNESLICYDNLSTPSSKPETGVDTLVTNIHNMEQTEIVQEPLPDKEIVPRNVEENSDPTTNTSEVDKHNRINIEGPDALAIIQTWLEETDLVIETRQDNVMIDLVSKNDDFNDNEKPDPVLYRTVSGESPEVTEGFRCLEYLSLSGCFKITDEGLG